MPEVEGTLAVAREWVEKAENDLLNATHTLTIGRGCPTDTICFHAQQCVEKYLKALLTLSETEIPRTHDIRTLLALVPTDVRPELADDEMDRLTEYATTTRYPGDYDPISLAEARRAVAMARRLRRRVHRTLPGSVRPPPL